MRQRAGLRALFLFGRSQSGLRVLQHCATLQHMSTLNTPPLTRPLRPRRVMINIDVDTWQALHALAYASESSLSLVASEVLRLLVPTVQPVVEAMAELRTAPRVAMEKLSLHAEAVAHMADEVVDEMRKQRRATPPSSNTGV